MMGESSTLISRGGRHGLGAQDRVKGGHPVLRIVKIRGHI